MTLPPSQISAHTPSPSSAPAKLFDQAPPPNSSPTTNPVPTPAKSIPPSLQPPSALIDATPYRIPAPLPDAAYYLPSFITAREEVAIIAAINNAPARRWVHLAHRRLQVYPCPVTDKGALVVSSAKDLELPGWMEAVVERLSRVRLPGGRGVFAPDEHGGGAERGGNGGGAGQVPRPNHCLVNEYRPGQGIDMHEDGPAYVPVVATVTLGSYGVLNTVHKDHRHGSPAAAANSAIADPDLGAVDDNVAPWRILQERRSLLISTADVYTQCLHGIEATDRDEDWFGRQDSHKRVVNAELLGAGRAGPGKRSRDGGTAAVEEEAEEAGREGEEDTFEAGIGIRGTRLSLTFRVVRKTKTVGKVFGQRVGGGGVVR